MKSEKEIKREKLNHLWDSIGDNSIDYLNNSFKLIAPKLLEFLIVSLLNEDELDIGIFSEKSRSGAIVSYDIYNSDKQLSLKLLPKNVFKLELLIYDSDGILKTFNYKLDSIEIKMIPHGLINIMQEVLSELKSKTLKIGGLI